jgi:hypothetical protein
MLSWCRSAIPNSNLPVNSTLRSLHWFVTYVEVKKNQTVGFRNRFQDFFLEEQEDGTTGVEQVMSFLKDEKVFAEAAEVLLGLSLNNSTLECPPDGWLPPISPLVWVQLACRPSSRRTKKPWPTSKLPRLRKRYTAASTQRCYWLASAREEKKKKKKK